MKSMAGQKRALEDDSSRNVKKSKLAKDKSKDLTEKPVQLVSNLMNHEIDFPRGGGTSLTAAEVKAIRAEAIHEADNELFTDLLQTPGKSLTQSRRFENKGKKSATPKEDVVRIEHLNYKRIVPGMKFLGQIVSVQSLVLLVSLPNQLMGHVPITQVTSQFTNRLESMHEQEELPDPESVNDGGSDSQTEVPDLCQLFHPGQYVRAVVTNVHASGFTNISGINKSSDDAAKASRRIELSLVPKTVNSGVLKTDLNPGFTLSAAVQSVEDHGYILDIGVQGSSGFLSFQSAQKGGCGSSKFQVGQLLDVAVVKVSSNERICTVSIDSQCIQSSLITEVSNVTSVLPGILGQALITAMSPSGLNLQILGFFHATADEFHVPGNPSKRFKIGQKVKARILYEIPGSSPPRFSVSLLDHVVNLEEKLATHGIPDNAVMRLAYPIGKILDAIKVKRVELERGLVVEVEPDLDGFIHISHVSDAYVSMLSSSFGPWRLNTIHRARVVGYHPLDGLLQLSLRVSVLEQRFVQAGDIQIGEVLKGTVKCLTDSALLVSISGNVDGIIWPNHFADIPLKHPSRRFKVGGNIKCRVLAIDPQRKRVELTAKRTLVESTLPFLASIEDAKIGMVTDAVVYRVVDKGLVVQLFNDLKAFVSSSEASEDSNKLEDIFVAGRVVKVRILSVDLDPPRIFGSIRQALSSTAATVTDISNIAIGAVVEGVVAEIHTTTVVLSLRPSHARALISLKALADLRSSTVPQLKASLKVGEMIESLMVISRNEQQAFVSVAGRSKAPNVLKRGQLTFDSLTIGQVVGGRVTRHDRHGARIKITGRVSGTLHPTDACDDYDAGISFPAPDFIVKASVVEIDKSARHLILSSRPSRLTPVSATPVVDREINTLNDLNVGDSVRGFIKSVMDHGLFVMLGRNIDARVQIRELFDGYVKDWKTRFEPNQLVKGRILNVDSENNKVEMTFRSGDLKQDAPSLAFDGLHEGQKVRGRVKRVEQYGLFIEVDGTKISGLCHKSQLSDNKDADVTIALRTFREGDRVRAHVLSIDKEKRRLSFSLKPSHLVGKDSDVELGSLLEGEGVLGVVAGDDFEMQEAIDAESDGYSEHSYPHEGPDSEGGDESEVGDEDVAVDLPMPSQSRSTWRSPTPKQVWPLKAEGFSWFSGDARPDVDSDETSSSDKDSEDDESSKRKKRRKKKEIEQDLTADMHAKLPESNADFERLLLGSPNSSYLWVQYMSFFLQLSEIDKARATGRRAIQTISFREEQERLNIWIALLNVENVYGTDESLEAVFKDAARHNDSKTIHLRLAAILDQSQKHENAEDRYKRTCKKFGYSSKVWTLFCEYYLRRGDLEKARRLLPRSLQSLEKRKHLKTISKFARLEYKLGDAERGKTIFEGIVDSHPKRWDLWSIYIDMEAGQGDIQTLRNIFNRMFAIKMTSQKAKSFFKKWLELERKIGSEEGASVVKQKAVEWTQKAACRSQ